MMEPIIVRGAGDIATGSIYMLVKAGYPVICLDIPKPSAIRRTVSFCQAAYEGKATVQDMTCYLARDFKEAREISMKGEVALLLDEKCECLKEYKPWFLVDAILAKKNLGTTRDMANVTVGLGPGFIAGIDTDYVIETQRGHSLGRIIDKGAAIPNTGVPGMIGGYSRERVIHSPAEGIIRNLHEIGDLVEKGQVIAVIEDRGQETPVLASLTGILRGIIQDGYHVSLGLKMADIDPRQDEQKNCYTISDKARTIGGAVLQLACATEHGIL